jgi:hypothetical protein
MLFKQYLALSDSPFERGVEPANYKTSAHYNTKKPSLP